MSSQTTRHTNIPASYFVLMRDNQVMLLRRCNTGFEDGNYGLISGHVEEGETFTQALMREAAEEANITLRPGDIEVVHMMHRKSTDSERIDTFFIARSWQGEPKNLEPNKCDDMSWFDLDQLPENTISNIKLALSHIKNGTFYSEYGWERE